MSPGPGALGRVQLGGAGGDPGLWQCHLCQEQQCQIRVLLQRDTKRQEGDGVTPKPARLPALQHVPCTGLTAGGFPWKGSKKGREGNQFCSRWGRWLWAVPAVTLGSGLRAARSGEEPGSCRGVLLSDLRGQAVAAVPNAMVTAGQGAWLLSPVPAHSSGHGVGGAQMWPPCVGGQKPSRGAASGG